MEAVNNDGTGGPGASPTSEPSKMGQIRSKILAGKPDRVYTIGHNPNMSRASETLFINGEVAYLCQKSFFGDRSGAQIYIPATGALFREEQIFYSSVRIGEWWVYPIHGEVGKSAFFFRVMSGVRSVSRVWRITPNGTLDDRSGYHTPGITGLPLAHVLLDQDTHLGQVRYHSREVGASQLWVVVCEQHNEYSSSVLRASVDKPLADYHEGKQSVHVSVLRSETGDRLVVGLDGIPGSSKSRVWSISTDAVTELELPEGILAPGVSLKGLVAKAGVIHLLGQELGSAGNTHLFTSIDGNTFTSRVFEMAVPIVGAIDSPALRSSELLVHGVGGSIHVLNTETGTHSGRDAIEPSGGFRDLRAVDSGDSVCLIGDLYPTSEWEFEARTVVLRYFPNPASIFDYRIGVPSKASAPLEEVGIRSNLWGWRPDSDFSLEGKWPGSCVVSPSGGRLRLVRQAKSFSSAMLEVVDFETKEVLSKVDALEGKLGLGEWSVFPVISAEHRSCVVAGRRYRIENRLWEVSPNGEIHEKGRFGLASDDLVLANALLNNGQHLVRVFYSSYEHKVYVSVGERAIPVKPPRPSRSLFPYSEYRLATGDKYYGIPSLHFSLLSKEGGDRLIVGFDADPKVHAPIRIWSIGPDDCEQIKLPSVFQSEGTALRGLVAKRGRAHLLVARDGPSPWTLIGTWSGGEEFEVSSIDMNLRVKGALDCPGLADDEVLLHTESGTIHVLNTNTGEVSKGSTPPEVAGSFRNMRAVDSSGSVYIVGDFLPEGEEAKARKRIFGFRRDD